MKTRNLISFFAGASLLCLGMIMGRGTGEPKPNRNEHLVMSVLWFQRSAEAKALYYQAFNIARLRIDENSRTKATRKRAVVVDIDETLLNNSPHSVKLIKENEVFPFAWSDWVNRAEAEPLPGSVEFLTYAVSKGYDVFYVSNRSEATEQEGTVRNLVAKGFPQVTKDHMMLKETESSKNARRIAIGKTHDIVLLMGDNLNDLATVFERLSTEDRASQVGKIKEEFGKKFIVLPNPMYGDWENAVCGYRRGLTDEQKKAMRQSALQSF